MTTRLALSTVSRAARPVACARLRGTPSALTRHFASNDGKNGGIALYQQVASFSSSGNTPPPAGGDNSAPAPPSAQETSNQPPRESPPNSTEGASGKSDEQSGGGGRRPWVPKGPVTWTSMAVTTVIGGLALMYYRAEKKKRESRVVSQVKSVGKPLLGGPFTLVDMYGKPVTDKDFHGSFVMLYFGFCHCPDICPSELVKLGTITKKLADKLGDGVVKPVFISVDPERDSLVQLRHYSKDFHEGIQYLTGTKDQVEKAAKSYRVYFSKTEEHDENEPYLVDHSIVIYLLAPNGDFLDFFTQRATIVDCVERTLKEVKNYEAGAA